MKKLLILTLFLSIKAFCQKHDLGDVTIEELKQKQHSIDTNAVAAILFKTGEVSYNYSQESGFFILTNVKMKIKIYKKEGYDWANFEIPLYNETNAKQTLSVKSAATYNLVGNKIEKSKLKSDGEFNEKINQFWSKKKIVMPNVKEGSIIEIDYTIKDLGMGTLDEWEFQTSIPIDYVEYKTHIPEYYVYNTHFRGWLTPKVTKEIKNESISIKSKERQYGGNLVSTTFSDDQINYLENRTTYILENVPAIKNESYVNNIKNYTSSLVHELSMTKFPNTMVKTYSYDWETVTKSIYDYDDFGPELNKTGYFENEINELIKDISSPAEKAGLIFSFVKNRMNWNEMNGYGCLNGVRKAYQDKTGNTADINLMLTSMLRYAGLNANPVILSTRSNGVALYPSRSAFNYVITGIELENQVLLLDATNKYSLPGILPIRDLNFSGRIIRNNGSSASIGLMPKNISNDVVNIFANITPEGEIVGKIREQHFDYYAFIFRNNYNGVSKESYIAKLEKENLGLEITDYDVQNNNDLSKPIVENYSFTNTNVTEIIGDKIYISPLLFFAKTENPFKQENRKYPVDFSVPFKDSFSIVINIPEGYEIESLPESVNLSMEDNYGYFSFSIGKGINSIQISSNCSINSSIIPSEYYDTLKNFYKMMIEKQNEKIVLIKI